MNTQQKRTKLILLFTIIIISFASCQRMILGAYGVERNPKAKTYEEIINYISSNKYSDSNHYTVNNLGIEFFNKMSDEIHAFYLFDKNGNVLKDSSNNACLENKIDKIEYIIKNNYFKTDTSISLEKLSKYIKKDIYSNEDSFKGSLLDSESNYYVLLTWATYLGKFNNIKYLNWYNKTLQIKEKYNIKIISINLDFLKGESYDNLNFKPRN